MNQQRKFDCGDIVILPNGKFARIFSYEWGKNRNPFHRMITPSEWVYKCTTKETGVGDNWAEYKESDLKSIFEDQMDKRK